MSIPEKCTVLVIGGGPSGSYTAAALARENIDTVLLEADVFPRYHIGESMIPSMRHFLKFIELDETFDKHGFRRKNGASFKLNASKPAAYTDFLLANGKDSYAWNVIRSESDHLMFKHAGKSGAKIFDGVKVGSVNFEPSDGTVGSVAPDIPVLGRPTSATWSRKSDGSSGTINFEYLVDGSGRFGLVSTKYMKNRRYNQGLKNIANWGYFQGLGTYAPDTVREGQPFFEALSDASGWAWIIPLHDGTTSVGVVVNQEEATRKKKEMETPSTQGFYLDTLMNNTVQVKELLANAKLVSDVKAASDWSYSASGYASENIRIVGDAGCFIDPFFSSGVHLALASALSAAVTICAALRGDCTEQAAMTWHSKKVAEGYTRFLLVVLSSLKQIRQQEAPVLNDFDEESFDRAFFLFRPIIQGTVDVTGKLTQGEVSDTVDFCMHAFEFVKQEDRDKVLNKLESLGVDTSSEDFITKGLSSVELEKDLSPSELKIVRNIQARRLVRSEDQVSIANFSVDIIDGLAPRMDVGNLGLMPGSQVKMRESVRDVMAKITGEDVFNARVPKMPDAVKA